MLLLIASLTLLAWIGVLIECAVGVRTIRSVEDLEPLEDPLPVVSIIVAARNEAPSIETAVESMLAMDYPHLQVVVVDDRSTDGTGAALDRLAARHPGLTVLHNDTLPSGWLGKVHALQLGAQEARGEFLLFTDADIHFGPVALRRAMRYVDERNLDHLAIAPEARVPGYWGGAFFSFFALAFSQFVRPWRARNPRSKAHIGIGAFNLVRAEAYRAIGGHQGVRLNPDDDVKLGRALKRAGYRQDMLFAHEDVRVDWYGSVGEMVRGLEKNSFAAMNYSLPAVLGACAAGMTANVWPWLALLATRGLVWWLNLAVVAVMAAVWLVGGAAPGAKFRYFPALPVTASLFFYTILRSAAVTLRQGGVRWRDTFYPLEELRAFEQDSP
jgi:hypothetical protein